MCVVLVQALSTLLHPQHGRSQLAEVTATSSGAKALQETVLRAEVTDVILTAVQAAGHAHSSGNDGIDAG